MLKRREALKVMAAAAAATAITRSTANGMTPGQATASADVFALLGDSRVAQVHADFGSFKNRTGYNYLNWANALSGQRISFAGNWGKSGDRTDEVLGRLEAALASAAGTMYLHAGVNDIAQAFPSLQEAAKTAAANISTMADAAIRRGMQVVIVLEPGCAQFDTPRVQQVLDLNSRLRDYASANPAAVTLFDVPSAVWSDPLAKRKIAFPANYYREDGTHPADLGAFVAGQLLARTVKANYQVLPPLTGRELLKYPTFENQTGGVAGSKRVKGDIASGWRVDASEGASVVCSVERAPKGMGMQQTLHCTFSAPNDEVRLIQDIPMSDWQVGLSVQAECSLSVSGRSVNLAGAYNYLQANGEVDGKNAAVTAMDLFTDGTLGTDQPYAVRLRTERLAIPNFTKRLWLTNYLRVLGAGKGSATIHFSDAALVS